MMKYFFELVAVAYIGVGIFDRFISGATYHEMLQSIIMGFLMVLMADLMERKGL